MGGSDIPELLQPPTPLAFATRKYFENDDLPVRKERCQSEKHADIAQNPTLFMGHSERIMKEPTGIPMRDWANEVPNDGLIRYLHWFNNERVLITSERALSEVLVTKNYDFIKPNLIRTGLARILGVGILLAEGDEHKVRGLTVGVLVIH